MSIYETIKNTEYMSVPRKVYMHTFGCQMNVHDSERLVGEALLFGYTVTEDEKEADLILVNTCCVREHAEVKVYGLLGTYKELKKKKPELIIGVCGCMLQQEGEAKRIARRFPYVDMVFGTHNTGDFKDYLARVILNGERIVNVWDKEGPVQEDMVYARGEGVRAWVNIMYGCNNFCSYCIVPYVRGRERSREPETIYKEVKELAEQGYQEVYLLGQNVNSYGKDLKEPMTFANLLRMLDGAGVPRLRFMTSHPKDISDDLIEAMAELPHVMESLHLPVQSGSDRVLKEMNRRYTKETYLGIVERARKRIPGLTLSADMIVGFPGETEEDFQETMDLVRKARYMSVYAFKYSPRTGTPAAVMENQIPDKVKTDRLMRLNALVQEIALEDSAKLVGREVEVLIEGKNERHSDYYTGRSRENMVISVKSPTDIVGQIVKAKITLSDRWALFAELI